MIDAGDGGVPGSREGGSDGWLDGGRIPHGHQIVGRKKHGSLMAPCRVGSSSSPAKPVDAGPVGSSLADIYIYMQMQQMHRLDYTIQGSSFVH